MNSELNKRFWRLGLLGTLVLALSVVSAADGEDCREGRQIQVQHDLSAGREPSFSQPYSSSDQQQQEQVVQELEALPTRQTKEFYRQALRQARKERDSNLTTILPAERQRQTNPGQELEQAKETQTSRIKEQKQSLDVQQQAKQAGVAFERMVEELKAFPVGKDKEFYQQALKARGYKILDARNDQNQTEFAIEKEGHNLRLIVQFDKETGKSTEVNASGARLAKIQ